MEKDKRKKEKAKEIPGMMEKNDLTVRLKGQAVQIGAGGRSLKKRSPRK